MITLANSLIATKFGITDIVQTFPQNVISNNTTTNSIQTYYKFMLTAISQIKTSNNINISTIKSNITTDLTNISYL